MFEKLCRLLFVFFMLSIAINAYSQSADYGKASRIPEDGGAAER